MKMLLIGAALLVLAAEATALNKGDCFTESVARARLAAEGQRIFSTPGGGVGLVIWMTKDSADRGYMLRQQVNLQHCVESVLPTVTTIHQASPMPDVCLDSSSSGEAKQVCARLKQQGFKVGRKLSADSSSSSVNPKLVGRVFSEFGICLNGAGQDMLCAISDTLQSTK